MVIAISDILPVVIFFQSTLFVLVLLTDNGPKKNSNRYLAAFLLVLGLQFAAITSKIFRFESSFIESCFCVYGFIYGPILFFYTRSLVFRSFHFIVKQLIHLIPALVLIVFALTPYSMCRPFGPLLYVSLIIYVSAAIRELISYRKVVKATQSTSAKTDLIWLQWTVILFSITLLLDIVDHFVYPMKLIYNISAIHLTILLLVNWMFYKGLKQPQIFLGITKSEERVVKERYVSDEVQILTDEVKTELERIKSFMESSKVFTNAELSLTELATILDLSPRKLSNLINNYLQQNFVGFINEFRIELAKSRLANTNDQNETILEIMYEVGFNSKSSFNTIFKQYTGQTPSEFKKKHNK